MADFKKTVCVDLDGVLASYTGWKGLDNIGDPLPGAVAFMERLHQKYKVTVYTTRCTAQMDDRPEGISAAALQCMVKGWLDKHGFVYDEIWAGQGKPIYAAVVDDRAIGCQPQRDGAAAYAAALGDVDYLCEGRAT